MGQVTIYLDSKIEIKMRAFIKSMHISQSKWIANLIEEKIKNEWPESIIKMAGTWNDIPSAEEIRRTEGIDIKREEI